MNVYDKHVNLSASKHQKYFLLLVGWKLAMQHVAHHPDWQPYDFASIVEDVFRLRDDLSVTAARAAVLHAFVLERSDGWMYLVHALLGRRMRTTIRRAAVCRNSCTMRTLMRWLNAYLPA